MHIYYAYAYVYICMHLHKEMGYTLLLPFSLHKLVHVLR